MRPTIPENIGAAIATLEGFSLRTLATELSPLNLSAAQLRTIASMIATRGGCGVFPAPSGNPPARVCSCLVDGRSRTIILGSGQSLTCFVEGGKERLIFFPRPGQAGTVALRVEAWNEDAASTRQAMLTRDEQYRYALDGRWMQVLASTTEQVRCTFVHCEAGQSTHVILRTLAFWPFVFGTTNWQEIFQAQISAAHGAALLGLSMLTVTRRIGEGKLPAVRSHSKYPAIELAGLLEYLAYRQRFPQGHPNLRRIEEWQQEWRRNYHAELATERVFAAAKGPLRPCNEKASEDE